MAGLIYELVDVIEAEANLYDELYDLCLAKNKVIIKADTDSLNSITKSEQDMITKIQNMEKKREHLINEFSIVLNQNASDLTISKLEGILKDQANEYNALTKASTHIRNALKKIKEINDQNAVLLKQSIEYVDYTVNVIQSSFDTPKVSYGSYGNENTSSNASFFDRTQ